MKKHLLLLLLLLGSVLTAQAATDCKKIVKNHKFIHEQHDNVDLRQFTKDGKPYTEPELLGYWETIDFVDEISQFVPGDPKTPAKDLFLQEMVILENGKIAGETAVLVPGHILDSEELTDESYEIRKIGNETYLFRQWKSGDYTCRGMKPSYYVLRKAPYSTGQWPDKTDLPFVNDPEVVGQWKAIDFVEHPEQFIPGKKFAKMDLYLQTLTFKENGRMNYYPIVSWTKGFVLHQNDKTASAYTIKKINGKKYMFFEWKSGDYVFRGMKPQFYVLEKVK